jgi:hypothetical protein
VLEVTCPSDCKGVTYFVLTGLSPKSNFETVIHFKELMQFIVSREFFRVLIPHSSGLGEGGCFCTEEAQYWESRVYGICTSLLCVIGKDCFPKPSCSLKGTTMLLIVE